MAKDIIDLEIPMLKYREDWTAQDFVYARMRNALMLGAIPPLTPISIRSLVNVFDASATPIREAIRRLCSEGALAVLDNRRFRVPDMTLEKFDELLALRVALETHSILRAEPYIYPIIIEQLQKIDNELDIAISEQRYRDAVERNYAFHKRIYMANPNNMSMPLIESVWLQLGPIQGQIAANGYTNYLVDRHKEIISALKKHDIEAIKKTIYADINDALQKAGHQLLNKNNL